MSRYADYTIASTDYDQTRVVVGVDIIVNCLKQIGTPLHEQAVLEAGCGTGNYLEALHQHLGRLVGIDVNDGMLTRAREKLHEAVATSGDLQSHSEREVRRHVSCRPV